MSGHWTRKARVDIVPLLDVLVILVFFFLVFGSIDEGSAALPVNLPASRTAPPSANERLVITVDAAGDYSVAGRRTAPAEIPGLVAGALADNAALQVVLFPDRSVPYEVLVEALDLIRQGGADRSALGVRRETYMETGRGS